MDPYYSRKEVSNSDLTELKKLMGGYDETDPTAAFRFGNLIDHMITELDKVNYYSLMCNGEQCTREEFETSIEMKKRFMRDQLCSSMLKLSDTQKTMIVNNREFNWGNFKFKLDIRCKWDLYMSSLGWGGDIKSTVATTQKQFEDAIRYFDYDRSRAWYMDIAGSNQDIVIGISKVNFKIFKVPIKRGDALYNSGLEKYNDLAFKWWTLFGEV